ncbi:hypothetical protein LUZ60_015879 [Juncus effusus]|nr:hypothetical protein LUZ60_015879 [Juncus effusus]
MQKLSQPTHPTCILLLHSCSSVSHLLELHGQILRNHLFFHPLASSRLLSLCASLPLASLRYAHNLFDQIPQKTTHLFNTLIKAYSNSPYRFRSFELFKSMVELNIRPDYFTFPSLLKSCGNLSAGSQIHGHMVKSGFDKDVFSINGLIHMYSLCGQVDHSQRIFYTSTDRDAATWTVLLAGYINGGLINHANKLFDEMPKKEIVSYNVMINGYMKIGSVKMAHELFDEMPMRNIDSWNTLISGYLKCGNINTAIKLFKEMPKKDVISWSTIITGCVQMGFANEALSFFEEMKELGFKPNKPAIVSLLSACSQIGFLEKSIKIHDYIKKNKVEIDSIVGSALIDMYMKCGCTERAFQTFHNLSEKNVICYTSMIYGLGFNGQVSKSMDLFSQMENENIQPNGSTFVAILCACSHAGLVVQALKYFNSMKVKFGIDPRIEHYGCLIDAFCRAGFLHEALNIIELFPNNEILWGNMLGACSIYGNDLIGEIVVKKMLGLKCGFDFDGFDILLANIYSMKGKWNEASEIKFEMELKGFEKKAGYSMIQI